MAGAPYLKSTQLAREAVTHLASRPPIDLAVAAVLAVLCLVSYYQNRKATR